MNAEPVQTPGQSIVMRVMCSQAPMTTTFQCSPIAFVLDVAQTISRLRLENESRRWPTVQHRLDIVQGQHAHCCTGFDRGAADMRQ
jgi:hypothetical protein